MLKKKIKARYKNKQRKFRQNWEHQTKAQFFSLWVKLPGGAGNAMAFLMKTNRVRQQRKWKQFSWWVRPHGEQGRNGKLPWGRSCWRRSDALWLAPDDGGHNYVKRWDDKNDVAWVSPQREQNKVSVWAQRNSSCPPERWSIRSVAEISLWPDLIIFMTTATTMTTVWGRKCQLKFQSVQRHWVLDQEPFIT